MRYTYASDTITHLGTGHKLQQSSLPIKSTIEPADFNMIIWSLMAVVEHAGLAATDFNPDAPATYQVVRDAILKMVTAAKPVGQVITGYWAAAPAGTVLLVGAEVNRATYPALWAHAQAIGAVVTDGAWATDKGKFSSGNGATTFRLPDLSNEFVRILGGGRVLGNKQRDDLKAHNHELLDSATDGSTPNVQAFGQPGAALNGLSSFTQDTGGTETRPRNVALLAAMYY